MNLQEWLLKFLSTKQAKHQSRRGGGLYREVPRHCSMGTVAPSGLQIKELAPD